MAAQGLRERPGAYDLASELSAATGKDCARVDQVREPLFLDQAADRHDPWGTVFWRFVWEPLEIEAVVDALHVSCRATEHPAQVLQIVVAHRDHGRCIAQLPSQIVRPDALMEEVLGVCSEAVRQSGEARGEPRHGCGCAGEMCVQVANAFQQRLASKQRRLADVAGFLPMGCFQRLPQARQDVACLLEHLPEAGGPQRISGEGVGREAFGRQEQVIRRRSHSSDHILKVRVIRRAEGEDLQPQAGPFVRNELVHNEGF